MLPVLLLLVCQSLAFLPSLATDSATITTSSSPSSRRQNHVPCRSIDAAFSLPNDQVGTFFLSRRHFIEYDFRLEAEKRHGRISQLGITQTGVHGAFSGPGSDVIILKGCDYHRYDASQGLPLRLVETRHVTEMGLPCHVDAAIRWANQTVVFKGCNTWRLNASTGLFHSHGENVTSRHLPCDIDSALEWVGGVAIFIKGHNYWKFDWQTTGPHHTDGLHLCSWYLCGEADWMFDRPLAGDVTSCNGDPRLCPLTLDQVTLPGLHNAGAGFYGGFGFMNCWMRNHGLNITRQLELGIRYLDIDACYETCGLLGTCHAFACGGSLCMMFKQIRYFLRSHPHDVIALFFNHEIVDERKVFRELTKQLKVQLAPMLSTHYRQPETSGWPTLRHSILTNRRLFIFYPPIIERPEYRRRYRQNPWIHSGALLGRTWRPFQVYFSCEIVVNLTASRCDVKQYRPLVVISVIPEQGGCVSSMASSCRPYLHQVLKVCQPYRFRNGKSPNVIMVDYPEVEAQEMTSVFNAAYHQNVRNVARFRPGECRVSIQAAVSLLHSDTALLFTATRIVRFHHRLGMQTSISTTPDHLRHIDAAYESTQPGHFYVIQDCQHTEIHAESLIAVTSHTQNETECVHNVEAAVRYQNVLYFFQECQIKRSDSTVAIATSDWGLPCHVDAAVTSKDGRRMYVFKGNNLWRYEGGAVASSYEGSALDWSVDVVDCYDTQ